MGRLLSQRALGGRKKRPGSIWFGERIVDGLLFPVLALACAAGAGALLQTAFALAVFKLAVPILASLVIIRLVVRVLRAAFPASPLVRALETHRLRMSGGVGKHLLHNWPTSY